MKVKSLSCVRLLATPWTAAYQVPPSMGFSRQEYGVGCHCLLWSDSIAYILNQCSYLSSEKVVDLTVTINEVSNRKQRSNCGVLEGLTILYSRQSCRSEPDQGTTWWSFHIGSYWQCCILTLCSLALIKTKELIKINFHTCSAAAWKFIMSKYVSHAFTAN